MDKDRAHFEFRVFGPRLDHLEEMIRRTFTARNEVTSLETYILSRASDSYNTKIRRGKIDIKALLGIERGLEKWARSFTETFPLDNRVIADKVFTSLELQPPHLERCRYTVEQFLEELVMPRQELSAVRVSKKRTLFMKGCCEAEFAELEIAGKRIYTAALESDETVPLLDLIQDFGLAGQGNTNYITALKGVTHFI
jgi:hypothetical protein